MNCIKVLLFSLIFLFSQNLFSQLAPVGGWKNYIPYNEAQGLCDAGNTIYAYSSTSFFSLDKTQNIFKKYDKTDGLSDWQVKTLAYSSSTKKLIVAYKSSKLDVIDEFDRVTNVFDIYTKNIASSKEIHKIFIKNNIAFICSDFGVSEYNLDTYEFGDTYVVGASGAFEAVYDMIEFQGKYFLAGANGVKEAPSTSNILFDFNQWTTHTLALQNLPNNLCRKLAVYDNYLYGTFGDKIYRYDGTTWALFAFELGASYNSLRPYQNGILSTSSTYVSGALTKHRTVKYTLPAGTADTLAAPQVYNSVDAILDAENDLYIAGQNDFFFSQNAGNLERANPSVFYQTNAYRLIENSGIMYLAPDFPSNRFSNQGFSIFENGAWTRINAENVNNSLDLNCISVRNTDKSVFLGSYRNGLVQYKNGIATNYNSTNSPINANVNDPQIQFIGGIDTDSKNNVWFTNNGANEPILCLTPENQFYEFIPPFSISANNYLDVYIDKFNTLWIRTTNNNIALFNPGESLTSTSDDYWKLLSTSDGLPNSRPNVFVEDQNDDMWIGTETGVYLVRCTNNIFLGCDVEPIQTSLGGFSSPTLFDNVVVNSIAVDGGNRKWIGTNSGAYLVNSDGQEQIQYFNSANSPLLSDVVNSISINQESGEVFFLTTGGISSFRNDATAGKETNEQAYIFPNPVQKDYFGPITITGLFANSNIKITDQGNNLVYENTANGGSYSWNGKDYLGRDIVSGVYNVYVSSTESKESKVLKVLVLR